MPRYRVDVRYDMNFSMGKETIEFEAEDDAAAVAHMDEHEGGWLSPIKRGLRFERGTLARMVEPTLIET